MSGSEVLLENNFVVNSDDENELTTHAQDDNLMFLVNAGESKANITRSDEDKNEHNM